mmetsp:Transcript_39598/g.104525  ORF Transcript_39598/g.104525 Transcript_39598/m.104525 type:complete len:81 (-) Transcript_39598:649-891(-)
MPPPALTARADRGRPRSALQPPLLVRTVATGGTRAHVFAVLVRAAIVRSAHRSSQPLKAAARLCDAALAWMGVMDAQMPT